MRWLLLSSKDYRDRIADVLREHGHTSDLAGWHWSDGRLGDTPEAVFVDFNAEKLRFLEAGFWRGRGCPVVYLRHPHRENRTHADRLAATLGMYTVENLGHFRRTIADNPPYLRPNLGGFEASALALDCLAPVGLPAHVRCPACGSRSAAYVRTESDRHVYRCGGCLQYLTFSRDFPPVPEPARG